MPNTPTHFIYHGKATGKDKSGKGSTITMEYQPLVDGYFCPTPGNVQSAQMRFLLLLQNLAPVHRIEVAGRQRIKVHF